MRFNLFVATVSLIAYSGLAITLQEPEPELEFADEFAQKFHEELAQYAGDLDGDDDFA